MNTFNLWKIQLIRGIFALILALTLFLYPGLTLLLLISIFGAFFAMIGLFHIFYAFKIKKQNQSWKLFLIEGLLSFVIGCFVWFWPGITGMILVYILAAWLFITGLLQLANSVKLAKQYKHTFWLGLIGLISLFFGVYIAMHPGQGAIAIITIIGIYILVYAVLALISAYALKKSNLR
ncbi:MAG: hypothetical protein CMF49_09765 [Legionellales bacterium]|nr:hypothetical protein [Legionellales bacterium]|tara:strand:+ start:268 stop:801 length:534 start_codon:yes stop_codon:yes gene_type:complete